MKKLLFVAAPATLALALAACGSSDDASTDAEADSVEITTEEALDEVNEEPVATLPAGEADTTSEAAAPTGASVVNVDEQAADAEAAAADAAAAAEAATAAAEAEMR